MRRRRPPRPHRRRRFRRRGLRTLAVAALALLVLGGTAVAAGASPARPRAFGWLVPTAAPAGWARIVLPGSPGTTVASAPVFTSFGGDVGTVSVAVRDTRTVRAYLNLTPRQGREQLHGFARFRAHLLGEDDGRDVRVEATAEGVPFAGGTGSCVQERYTTRVAGNRYREVACLVAGRTTSVVVVAAARTELWGAFEPDLRRSLASLTVS